MTFASTRTHNRRTAVIRPLPVPTNEERAFWAGGAAGQLLVNRCDACGRWHHPPKPVCPHCFSTAVAPKPVSGRGTVWAATVNHQQWFATRDAPYVIAIVELAEQAGLRLLTNIVDCDPAQVHAGMAVTVGFEPLADDIWLPTFRPVAK